MVSTEGWTLPHMQAAGRRKSKTQMMRPPTRVTSPTQQVFSVILPDQFSPF